MVNSRRKTIVLNASEQNPDISWSGFNASVVEK